MRHPSGTPRPTRGPKARSTINIHICADTKIKLFNIKDLLRHRDLLLTFAGRDLRVRYKQTSLGVAWVLLQPILPALIFSFVFGVVARLPSEGRPYFLFAFTGMVAWNAFASVITRVGNSLLGNAHLLSKIYFPRLILPLANVATSLVDFGVTMALLVAILAVYPGRPGWAVLWIPFWVAILVAVAVGGGARRRLADPALSRRGARPPGRAPGGAVHQPRSHGRTRWSRAVTDGSSA